MSATSELEATALSLIVAERSTAQPTYESTISHRPSLLSSSFFEPRTCRKRRRRLKFSTLSSSENEEEVDDPQPRRGVKRGRDELAYDVI